MSSITIRPFKEIDREDLKDFKLSEQQLVYTSLPLDVLEDALGDADRMACVVVNDREGIIGFFILHKHYRHEGYDTQREVVFVRSLSINESVQGKGYGTKVALNLPIFVQDQFSDFDHLHLVVDADNTAAWNLYERAGFVHTATKEDGPIGLERLYYLDLDQKYVSNIRLRTVEGTKRPEIKIDIILDNQKTIGYLEGIIEDKTLFLKNVFVEEEERKRGIASSALRQLGTFLRRNVHEVREVAVEVNRDQNINQLFEYVGFARFKEPDGEQFHVKYIKY